MATFNAPPTPPPDTFKGRPQPPVKERLTNAKIFLADEDPARDIDFANRISQVEEYVAHVEAHNLAQDAEAQRLLRDVKIMLQVQRDWENDIKNPPVAACGQNLGPPPQSTRLINIETANAYQEEKKNMGITTQMREDHPPFTIDRTHDHAQFLAKMKEELGQNPILANPDTSLSHTDSRAYTWALLDPAVIPFWMHPTRGIPRTGVKESDPPPLYEQDTPNKTNRPPRGFFPTYLQIREDRINQLLQEYKHVRATGGSTIPTQELRDLITAHLPKELKAESDFVKTMISLGAEKMDDEMVSIYKEYADKVEEKFLSWLLEVAEVGIYFILRIPGITIAESDQLGVAYIDDGVLTPSRLEFLGVAQNLLDTVLNDGWSKLGPQEQSFVRYLLRDALPERIKKLEKDVLIILRRDGATQPDEIYDKKRLEEFNALNNRVIEEFAGWMREIQDIVPQPSLQYLRPGELATTDQNILYIEWDKDKMPEGQPKMMVKSVPLILEVQREANYINDFLSRTRAGTDRDVGPYGSFDANWVRTMAHVAYPELRLMLGPWLAIQNRKRNKSYVSDVDDATYEIIDDKLRNAWNRWMRMFGGDCTVRMPLPKQEPESPDVFFCRRAISKDKNFDDWRKQLSEEINAKLASGQPSEEDNDFEDWWIHMEELCSELLFPTLWRLYIEKNQAIESQKYGDEYSVIAKDLVELWNQRFRSWIRAKIGRTTQIKARGGLDPLDDPTTVYYRGELPATLTTIETRALVIQHKADWTVLRGLLAPTDFPAGINDCLEALSREFQGSTRHEMYRQILKWYEMELVRGADQPDSSERQRQLQKLLQPDDKSPISGGLYDDPVDLSSTHSEFYFDKIVPHMFPHIMDVENEINRIQASLKNDNLGIDEREYDLRKLQAILQQFTPERLTIRYKRLEVLIAHIRKLEDLKSQMNYATATEIIDSQISELINQRDADVLVVQREHSEWICFLSDEVQIQVESAPIQDYGKDLLVFNPYFTKEKREWQLLGPDILPGESSTPVLVTRKFSEEGAKAYHQLTRREISTMRDDINRLLKKRRVRGDLDWDDSERLLSHLRQVMPISLAVLEAKLRQIDAKSRETLLTRDEIVRHTALWSHWKKSYREFLNTLPVEPQGSVMLRSSPTEPVNEDAFYLTVLRIERNIPPRSKKLPLHVVDDVSRLNKALQSFGSDNIPNSGYDTGDGNGDDSRELDLILRPIFRPVGDVLRRSLKNAFYVDILPPQLPNLQDIPSAEDYRPGQFAAFDPAEFSVLAYTKDKSTPPQMDQFSPTINLNQKRNQAKRFAQDSTLVAKVEEVFVESLTEIAYTIWSENVRKVAETQQIRAYEPIPGAVILQLESATSQTSSLPSQQEEAELRRQAGELYSCVYPGDMEELLRSFCNLAKDIWARRPLNPDDVQLLRTELPQISLGDLTSLKRDIASKLAKVAESSQRSRDTLLRQIKTLVTDYLWYGWSYMYPDMKQNVFPKPLVDPVETLIQPQSSASSNTEEIPAVPNPAEADVRAVQVEVNNLLYRQKSDPLTRIQFLELNYLLVALLPKYIKKIRTSMLELESQSVRQSGLSEGQSLDLVRLRKLYESSLAKFKRSLPNFGVIIDTYWYDQTTINEFWSRKQMWMNAIGSKDDNTIRKGYPSTSPSLEDAWMRLAYELYLVVKRFVDENCQDTGSDVILVDLPDQLKLRVQEIRKQKIVVDTSGASINDPASPAAVILWQMKAAFVQQYMTAIATLTFSNLQALGNRVAGMSLDRVDFTAKAQRRGIQRAAIELGLNYLATNQEQHRPMDRFRIVQLPGPYVSLERPDVPMWLPLEASKRPVEQEPFEYLERWEDRLAFVDEHYRDARVKAVVENPMVLPAPLNFDGPFPLPNENEMEACLRTYSATLSNLCTRLLKAQTAAPRPLMEELILLFGAGLHPNTTATHELSDNEPLTPMALKVLHELGFESWNMYWRDLPTGAALANITGDVEEGMRIELLANDIIRLEGDHEIGGTPFTWQDYLFQSATPNSVGQFEQIPYKFQHKSVRGLKLADFVQKVNDMRFRRDTIYGTVPSGINSEETHKLLPVLATYGRIHYDIQARLLSMIPLTGHPENKYVTSIEEVESSPFCVTNPATGNWQVQYDSAGKMGPFILQPNKIEFLRRSAFRVGRDILAANTKRSNLSNDMMDFIRQKIEATKEAVVRMPQIPQKCSLEVMAEDLLKVAPTLAQELGFNPTLADDEDHKVEHIKQCAALVQCEILEELNNNWESRFPENEDLWDFAAERVEPVIAHRGRHDIEVRPRIKMFFHMRRFPFACQSAMTQSVIKQSGPTIDTPPAEKPDTGPVPLVTREPPTRPDPVKKARHIKGRRPDFPFGETPYQRAFLSARMEEDLKDVPEFQAPTTQKRGFIASLRNEQEESPEPENPYALPEIPETWKPDNIFVADKRQQVIEQALKTPGMPQEREFYYTPDQIRELDEQEKYAKLQEEVRMTVDMVEKLTGKNINQLTAAERSAAEDALGIDRLTGRFTGVGAPVAKPGPMSLATKNVGSQRIKRTVVETPAPAQSTQHVTRNKRTTTSPKKGTSMIAAPKKSTPQTSSKKSISATNTKRQVRIPQTIPSSLAAQKSLLDEIKAEMKAINDEFTAQTEVPTEEEEDETNARHTELKEMRKSLLSAIQNAEKTPDLGLPETPTWELEVETRRSKRRAGGVSTSAEGDEDEVEEGRSTKRRAVRN